MEHFICYKVTYYVRSPWYTYNITKYYKDHETAKDIHDIETKKARQDNMFHNMPTIEEVLMLVVDGKTYCLGSAVDVVS